MVFKPSKDKHRLQVSFAMEAMGRVGLPKGVINLVQGAKETGIALAEAKEVDGVLLLAVPILDIFFIVSLLVNQEKC